MKQKIALIDVDYPIALLHPRWLELYNRDWNDALTEDKITEWAIHKFVKPECGKNIYKYLEYPDLYDAVQIREGSYEFVKDLKNLDVRVVFLTAGIHVGKYELLKRHGLVESQNDIIYATDKSLVHGDYMLDDYHININSFNNRNPRGIAFLFDAPHNQGFTQYNRVTSLQETFFFIEQHRNYEIHT